MNTGDTTSFSEFNSNVRNFLDQSRATGRPLFVTTDGETEAVVLSPAAFNELVNEAELSRSLAALDRSAEDVKAGRTRPAKAGLRQIANELNIPLHR